MGRRASSSLNATAIIAIMVVVLILIAAGAIALRKKKDTFDAPQLPIEDIYSNANSLRGNEYRVVGSVYRRGARDSGLGVSIMVDSGSEELPLFIIVPEDVANFNIDRDVTYAFKVRIGEGGVPIATGVKRL